MSNYKLEPTPEMVEAAEDAYMPFGDMDLAIRMALLAAPAVQGEPAEQQPVSHDWDNQDKCRRCGDRDWYASATCTPKPQPELAKYQPCGCVICTCEHETQCQGCGGHHCGTHPVGQFTAPAYLRPAPDVSALVEALEKIAQSCDSGRHDGLPEDGPALSDVEAWLVANDALAAHRKGGE